MKISHWLGILWGVMLLSTILKWKADTYVIVAMIILPMLIVLLDLHEEITNLKEDAKHQRKFVLDRYNALSEKIKDVSEQMERKMVVDFAEIAKNSEPTKERRAATDDYIERKRRKKKRRRDAESGPESLVPSDEHSISEATPSQKSVDGGQAMDDHPKSGELT